MLSIIITAYKEERSIAKAMSNIADESFSGLGKTDMDKQWELIVIAPDQPTLSAAENEAKRLKLSGKEFVLLKDEGKGKPAALNKSLKKAKGDWVLLSDGDVHFEKGAVGEIVKIALTDKEIGGVSARPKAEHKKDTMLNYWGALLADAADHKRKIDLTNHPEGISTKIIKKRKFFPLSGYGMLIKNLDIQLPEDTLIDDAYLSYEIYNKGYKLGYAENAIVRVKYPTNLDDYFKQKKRSTGGYIQLWKYGVVKQETKSRSFWRELEYFWFPIKYAKNLREIMWSLMLYPARLWLWLMIYWERKVIKKDFTKTWVRIESTK